MILKKRGALMHRFSRLFLPIIASFAIPAAGETPVIATKKYVDSGLATRVTNVVFDSFQNRAAGFATASQGAKADSAVQFVTLNNYVLKSEVTPGLSDLRNLSGSIPGGLAYGTGVSWSALYNSYLIEGIGMCLESTSDIEMQAIGPSCWCRMIRPVLGRTWVYVLTHGSLDVCRSHCAFNCTSCLRSHENFSCERSMLLAS
jgi:hypothetical protein